MAANSILPSGNTTFLPELENGTADLSLASLLIGTGVGNITLTSIDSGVLSVSGSIEPTDIVDNSGSIGTPGQVLAKASSGTDMLWSSSISVSGNISTEGAISANGAISADGAITAIGAITSSAGDITAPAGNISCATGIMTAQRFAGGIASYNDSIAVNLGANEATQITITLTNFVGSNTSTAYVASYNNQGAYSIFVAPAFESTDGTDTVVDVNIYNGSATASVDTTIYYSIIAMNNAL